MKAFFRFEASPLIGAGHAIRSCVIADALKDQGWDVLLVTNQSSYDFIPHLNRFPRADPGIFDVSPPKGDLLVVDHYGLDHAYERLFRPFMKKILVIDDLANRHHDCDILLDQTHGRSPDEYKPFVPSHCHILTGSDYVLIRKEIIALRPKALEKRRSTQCIETILVSMGGSDPGHFTLKALEMIKESDFTGHIDVVLGFSETGRDEVERYSKNIPNSYEIHVNADMGQLMYKADLCIGAAGSSVWERCCLGLPQVLIQTAENQKEIYNNLISKNVIYSNQSLNKNLKKIKNQKKSIFSQFDCTIFLKKVLSDVGY